MKGKILNNLPLKLVSVLIAIVIWYVVVDINDPIIRNTYEVPVQVTNEAYIAEGKKTYQITDGYQTVLVTVTGNSSVLHKIKASDIQVIADLTQIVMMDTDPVYVPLSVSCPGIAPENIRTHTTTIPIEVEDVGTARFPITIDTGNTKPDKDYEIGTMTANPENVTVSGPASLINKISSVVATIDVSGMSGSSRRSGAISIIDKNQEEMSESQMTFLSFDGGTPDVDVNVVLWRRQAGVRLASQYSGSPQRGYQVTDVYTTPEEITVAGSEEALQKLKEAGGSIVIPAEMVTVDGAKEDFETTVDISELVPEGMKISSSSSPSVTVHVTVLPNGSREFQLDVDSIRTTGLAGNLSILYDQTQIPVRIKASDRNLASFSAENIQASIDLTGLSAGDYTAALRITLPDNYELVDEVEVAVHLKERADATPKATEVTPKAADAG